MRITNNMMVNNFMRNINRNLNDLDATQMKLASGRTIQKPSDDPIGVTNSLRWRTGLTEVGEYLDKTEEAANWLDTADSALDSLTSVIQRVRELTVRGATSSLSETDRAAIAAEIDQLKEQVGQIANADYGDKYVFAGSKTNVPPYDPATYDPSTGVGWNGNSDPIKLEVGMGIQVQVNSDGGQIFNGTPRIFEVLGAISDHLKNDPSQLDADLAQIDLIKENVLNERSYLGAKINRVELHQARLEDLELNYTELLSQNEDADMAEVYMNLNMQESVYRASLSAGSRIIQPSLVDFLS